MASIGDDSIAVTSSGSTQINIIDTKKQELRKSLKVNSYNGRIVYKDGHLIYCAWEKGLQMISLNDETITNITNTKFQEMVYVTTFADKLFHSNGIFHSVSCCDYHGNILCSGFSIWYLCRQYYGNVYVAGSGTYNVVVISPDGQRYRQLLTSEDGLRFPSTLHYATSTNKLLVANLSDEAFLYDVK
ncbi:unnamed protein product [Mytilus coruscus]|uniref:Uncharacterized protein n=1 Tax=Mytilus coruscus TaxID=42192 RepID=A0A6J8C0S1_MYTCO|nr:unnamed protein product [Mytilus coruscus]